MDMQSIKVAVVQNSPVLGQPLISMQAVDRMLESFSAESGLHVVLLPELAFSGYTFSGRDAIRPFLEEAEAGPTFNWCSNQVSSCQNEGNIHSQGKLPRKHSISYIGNGSKYVSRTTFL